MNRAPVAALLCAALASAGCMDDFSPQSDLLGLRVLALVADPLELAPGQPVTIRPEEYVPAGDTDVVRRWTFCPLTAGSVSAYACAVPQCEVDLPTTDGTVTVNPTQIIQACLGWTGTTPPAQVPDVIQPVFRYRVTTSTGSREAVLQLPQWTRGPPPDPNLPPVIQGVEIGGVRWAPGAVLPPLPVNGTLPVRLLIDPASVQTYVDAAGVEQTETMTGYFYTTAGTFSNGITTGVDTTVDLEGTNVTAGQAPAQLWVVALDLRGGQAVAGPIAVTIGP
jgi:hypothetical protein